MNGHLTSRQISEFAAGLAEPAISQHAQECDVCRSEAERLSDTLGLFRQSVRQWSTEQEQRRPVTLHSHRKVTLRHLGWTAALAACLIAGLALPHDKNVKGVKPVPARRTISDAELLVQVDRELSEAVPPSMAPIELHEVQK
jgi:hypothetical protein